MSGIIHVVPVDDLREHLCDLACWCKPRTEDGGVDTYVVVHNSMDRREEYEEGRKLS